jgi:hypothetical protein
VETDRGAGPLAEASQLERLRLRYAGTCTQCGTPLSVGADALYDRLQKSVRCVSCPADRVGEPESPIDAGVAGASARREYERRVAGREARVKDRFGRRLGGVILALSDQPQSTRAWDRGSQGEQELANALAELDDLRVLNDRRVPGTRGNIDHIVVAPAGVFVVDAKRYDGIIRVRDVGGFFNRDERLYVGRRDCSKLADNMAWQLGAVDRAIRSGAAEPLPPITAVLCFVRGQWPLLSAPDSYRGVRLEGTRSIKKLFRANQVLDGAAIDQLARLLASSFPAK